jgi:hypothetical protein
MQQGQVERVIYVGVDTGRTEVERTFFPTSRRGCAEMLARARSRRRGGPLQRGVHGDLRCRSYFKHLSREHVQVVELKHPRPLRQAQEGQGRRRDGAQGRQEQDTVRDGKG